MKFDTTVKLANLTLKNPVMTASGTSGHGTELSDFFDLNKLGAFVTKGLSLNPKIGNASPRISETSVGLLNSIGLENPGIELFELETASELAKLDTVVIANFFGNDFDSYVSAAEKLGNNSAVDALEMNISCPNVKKGGLLFGTSPDEVKKLTLECKKVSAVPIFVKLTPLVSDFLEIATAAIEAGADGVTCINTLPGTDIDVRKRKFTLGAGRGGLSGPALLPLALLRVTEVRRRFPDIPIIGVGGISSGEDLIKFIMAGADAVEIGTAALINPMAYIDILEESILLAEELGISSFIEIRGAVL